MTKILVLARDSSLAAAVTHPLRQAGYQVVDSPHASVDIAITELEYGIELLESGVGFPVIVATHPLPSRSIIETMKRGAADLVFRPFEATQLLASVERAMAERRNQGGKTSATFDSPVPGMIGVCPQMRALFAQIHKVAPAESTVLVHGESGTGKELVARALHTHSTRRNAALISLNCAAIPETLIESELFGHERGAFTGAHQPRVGLIEAADGGTLFLDEIGELPLEAQARLLRVLQEGEIRRLGSTQTKRVNVRLIAATHRDLGQLTKTGQFREDLYYRLNVISLRLPPLRERVEDLPALVDFVLARTCIRLSKPHIQLDDDAMLAITAYSWPGNVRELENAIERAVILCDRPAITRELLAIDTVQRAPTAGFGAVRESPAESTHAHAGGSDSLDDYFINFVLQHQDGMTETELAGRLGISRKSLWERRQRFGIPRTRTKQTQR